MQSMLNTKPFCADLWVSWSGILSKPTCPFRFRVRMMGLVLSSTCNTRKRRGKGGSTVLKIVVSFSSVRFYRQERTARYCSTPDYRRMGGGAAISTAKTPNIPRYIRSYKRRQTDRKKKKHTHLRSDRHSGHDFNEPPVRPSVRSREWNGKIGLRRDFHYVSLHDQRL